MPRTRSRSRTSSRPSRSNRLARSPGRRSSTRSTSKDSGVPSMPLSGRVAMASPAVGRVFHGSDSLERSVWVVVDPRDFVTGARVTRPLDVRLKAVTAMPLVGRSGVYCFADLDVPAGSYTVRVHARGDRDHYFDAEKAFLLDTIPIPAQPLKRNLVT